MGQSGERPARRHFVLMTTALLLGALGCDRGDSKPTPSSQTSSTLPTSRPPAHPTVASLSPAATDILLAIGAQSHLVAVSNYDARKPGALGLPAAGDYLTVDWERLTVLKPEVLIVQVRENAAPAGFKQNAGELGIKPLFIHIDNLADVSTATLEIGAGINEREKAAAADAEMRKRLADVAKSVKDKPKVRTLVVTDEGGAGVAGTGTFLDELLTIAGGTNAAAGESPGYPGVDKEKILTLKPEAVLHLLPAKSAHSIEEAKRFWASLPEVPAVQSGRVYYLTDPSVMQPGLGVGNVAKMFADCLHLNAGKDARGAS
jgi:iron complex transport system substrate-binding protein